MQTLLEFLTWITALLGEDHAAVTSVASLTEVDGVVDSTPVDQALAHLADDDVAALTDGLREASANEDVEMGDLATIADSIDWLNSLAEARELAAEAEATERQALLERINGSTEDGDEDGSAEDGDEGEGDEDDGDGGGDAEAGAEAPEPALVAAGAAGAPAARRTPTGRVRAGQARRGAPAGDGPAFGPFAFVHSRQTAGFHRGQELRIGEGASDGLGAAMAEAQRDMSAMAEFPKEYVARCDYRDRVDENRRLRDGQHEENRRKVNAAVESRRLRRGANQGERLDALLAAGGLCAPLMPYYPLMELGNSGRPVRDALPGFVIDRGGVQVAEPPSFAAGDFAGGVAIWTAANDANPTDPATKPFLELACQDFIDVEMYAVTDGVLVSNFRQRSWPEQVETYINGSGLVHARTAESELIDSAVGMSAFSIAVAAAGPVYGFARDLLAEIDLKATIIRDIHRMEDDTLDVYLPRWIRAAIRSDIAKQMPGDGLGALAVADAEIEGWFRARGIRVVWFRDTQNYVQFQPGQDQVWHNEVTWYMHPTGSFLFGDAGTLDVGLFRDKGMVELNQYAIFSETFECLIPVGIRSSMIAVTQSICVNGAAAGTIDPTDLCSVS